VNYVGKHILTYAALELEQERLFAQNGRRGPLAPFAK